MDLKFCVHVGRKLGVEVDLTELDETVGLIYVCDEIEESIIKDIEEWEGAVMKGSLVFRLIVPSKGNSGNEAVDDWCFDNQAEIIELTREVEEDDDDEFVDKFGIDRIVEVMESNLWEVAQRKPLKAEDQELEAAAQLGIELDPVGADFMKNFRKVMKQDGMFDLETTINQLQQIRSYGETLPEDKRKDLAAFVSLMVANEIE
ncbi:hypothetical protein BC829DRAFT_234990 [Chytridium lagenaria]|nr:hypothetical protein BC829DRAFT_234990 [Chytridium lagenaria]